MDDTIKPDVTTDPTPIAEKRLKKTARGTITAQICDQTWLFADYVPSLGRVWDRIYDANCLRGEYPILDVQLAAYRLLVANYELLDDEAIVLIRSAETSDLVKAVETALFGPEKTHRTYTDWVTGSLATNGLKVSDIPAHQLNSVLEMLVATNRAVAPKDWISAAEYAVQRKAILGSVG